jgi:hypothetical protein
MFVAWHAKQKKDILNLGRIENGQTILPANVKENNKIIQQWKSIQKIV